MKQILSEQTSLHPLSYNQRSMWFLHQLAPESWAYNPLFTARIWSDVDIVALQRAFQSLVARHPSLRSTYVSCNGEPLQQIHEYQKVHFEEIDASSWSWEELNSCLIDTAHRPFDLERGPMLRVSLFTRLEKDRILLMTSHHIAVDAWAWGLFLDELRILYSIETGSTEASSPPHFGKQYTDYVSWQLEMLASQEGERLWRYWQKQLAGELPALNMPTDRPRQPVQTYCGASQVFRLSEELTQQIKALAQNEGTTLYRTLLAAFQVLLYRYTGQEDILVGVPTSGRNRREFLRLVGHFVNPVVIRADLSGNPTFKEFLAQVHYTVLDALLHQDYPFQLLVEQLKPKRDFSRSPIFQVIFNMPPMSQFKELSAFFVQDEDESLARINFGGLVLEPFFIAQQDGQLDISVEIWETGESLFGILKYNTDLFDAATITKMVGHFQTLLKGIVAEPQHRVSQLPLLTATERHQLLVECNNTHTEHLQDKCIHQLFEAQVEQTPDAVAVVFKDQQLTYRELNTRANQLANYLQGLGVGREVIVGISVERSLEMVVGLLGILKANGAYVPLDPGYPKERLAFMLKDTQVQVLLSQQHLVEGLPEHGAKLICLDSDWEVIAQQSQEHPVSDVTLDNLAYVIYTSGSTGRPKGVMMTHRPLSNLVSWQIGSSTLKNGAKTLQFAPVSFDVSFQEIFSTWLSGGTLVLISEEMRRDPVSLLNLIVDEAVERLFLPFVALQHLAEAADSQGAVPISLREIITSGEQLQITRQIANWFEKLKGCTLYNQYGPSETHVVTAFTLTGSPSDWPALPPIGRPISNAQIYLLDGQLQPVPTGVIGEMYIDGVSLARGYLNRPDLTIEKFIPNPFSKEHGRFLYKTGDLARYLPDGNIEFLGRIDHQVKIRGFRIELGEIEAMLSQHPAVQEAVVMVREDVPGDKRLVAYFVPKQKQATTINNLGRFLKEQLPEYMVPVAFVMLDTLPLTPSGKVDRKSLPAPNRSEFDLNLQDAFIAPRDNLELQLLRIWEKLLNINPISVTDNFFDLGGHSLLAVNLIAKIQKQFGQNLPLATLFQGSTIEQLASILRHQQGFTSWSPLVEIQPSGSRLPFFCVHPVGGNVLSYVELARCLGPDQPFYGLQAKGLDGQHSPYTKIEDMAAYYIEALRVVQPQGPYLLGGWSMGGIVAFEMAQQLQRQGHEVGLLALLDSWTPDYANKNSRGDFDDTALLSRFAEELGRRFGNTLPVSYDVLQQIHPLEQMNYILEQAKMAAIIPSDVGLMHLRPLLEVFKRNLQAIQNYVPQLYPNQITFFQASVKLSQDLSDSVLGWNDLTVKPVKVYTVPGNHYTMLTMPYVQVLSDQLRQVLGLLHESKNVEKAEFRRQMVAMNSSEIN